MWLTLLKSQFILKKLAFTLAEVLITLAIIGIVSALTIPSLLSNVNNAELKPLLRKNFSEAQQAFKRSAMDRGGSLAGYSALTGDNLLRSNELRDLVRPYVSYIKTCDNLADKSACIGVDIYKTADGNNWNVPSWNTWAYPKFESNYSVLVTNSGAYWYFFAYYDTFKDCTASWITPKNNSCGLIAIDTNGAKGPNRATYDLFEFHIDEGGNLIPMGSEFDVFKDSYSLSIGYNPGTINMLKN